MPAKFCRRNWNRKTAHDEVMTLASQTDPGILLLPPEQCADFLQELLEHILDSDAPGLVCPLAKGRFD